MCVRACYDSNSDGKIVQSLVGGQRERWQRGREEATARAKKKLKRGRRCHHQSRKRKLEPVEPTQRAKGLLESCDLAFFFLQISGAYLRILTKYLSITLDDIPLLDSRTSVTPRI